MRRVRLFSLLAGGVLLLAGGTAQAEQTEQEPSDAESFVAARVAAAGDAQAQAEVLAELAWPATPGDPRVAANARKKLVGFGENAFRTFLKTVRRAGPLYSADVTEAIIEAKMLVTAGMPADYLSSLEETLWHGSPDAKRLAIPILAYHHFLPALPACVDAMYLHPELTLLVVEELGNFGDRRGRFALEHVLRTGTPRERHAAARSLARIGGLALDILRTATLVDEAETRMAAIEAYLPVSGTADLTALYEYLGRRSDDDEELLGRVRQRAALLEQLLDRQMNLDSASEFDEHP